MEDLLSLRQFPIGSIEAVHYTGEFFKNDEDVKPVTKAQVRPLPPSKQTIMNMLIYKQGSSNHWSPVVRGRLVRQCGFLRFGTERSSYSFIRKL